MSPEERLQWLHKARAGDQKAFEHLVRELMPRLYGVVFSMIPNADEVYDILQESFLKGYRNLNRLHAPEAFVGWMTRIAVNTARTKLTRRREYATEPDALIFEWESVPDRAVQTLEHKELQQLLEAAMQQLSPDHREVVALVELEELNCAEAAKLLDCPAGTVRSRLHYARKKLKELLTPYYLGLKKETAHEP